MAYCCKCGKEITDSLEHYFCGYGYGNQYCEKCCPREYDGIVCEYPHPINEDPHPMKSLWLQINIDKEEC